MDIPPRHETHAFRNPPMDLHLLAFVPWLPDSSWAIPAIGGVACAVAMFVGWRVLHHRPLPPSEEEQLDARFLKGVTSERRATPRRKGNQVLVDVTTAKEGPTWIAVVQDRSIGGLGLLSEQSVAPGSVLRVRPQGATNIPWIDVTVRICRPEGSQYELGCQFHQTPSWSVLVMFG